MNQFGQVHADLAKHEGVTVDARTGTPATSGWAVAQAGHEEQVTSPSPADLHAYQGRHQSALHSAGHFGAWHEPASGETYLDTTKVHPDTYGGGVKAIADAHHHDQMSTFNIDRLQTMTTRPGETEPIRRDRQSGAISPQRARAAALASPTHTPEQAETRSAVRGIQAKNPGRKGRVATMPTAALARGIKNRQPYRPPA